MTVTFEDDPEISVVEEGGGDLNLPSPSAPDAVTASIIPENRPSLDNLPTATAEVATTMIPNTEAARVPSFVTRPLADGRTGNIERTTQLDGSLSVKVTTITHQPNGYRDMTMEYFHIPSDMSGTVSMAMDVAGEPPSSLYRTNIQHQTLPPSSGEVTPIPASEYAPVPAPTTTQGAPAAPARVTTLLPAGGRALDARAPSVVFEGT